MPETSALSQIVLHPVSATLNDEDINLSAEKVVMAEHIIAVSECADSLRFHSTPSISPLQTRLLSRSTGWLPSAGQQVESSDEEETEMAEMMAEGKKLRQLAENCAQQSDEYQISSSPPAHRFTAKMALLIGTGLLAGVVGSVAWQRARATERSNNSTELYRSEVPPPYSCMIIRWLIAQRTIMPVKMSIGASHYHNPLPELLHARQRPASHLSTMM